MSFMKFSSIIVSIALLLITSCLQGKEVSVSFTGDIIMHIPVKSSSLVMNRVDHDTKKSLNNEGFDFLFERIAPHLRKSDIVVGNMEFPIRPPFQSEPRIFNCYPDVLPALRKAGFTMVQLANNHILDQGAEGTRSTVEYAAEYGLDVVGAHLTEEEARRGVVKEVDGIRVGFVGYTGVTNYPLPKRHSRFHVNWFYRQDHVFEDIERIRPFCDYLILVVHTGTEYALDPDKRDRDLMRECVRKGVDLVVGHHPHLLQPVEKISAAGEGERTGYIFYSLGNFISNQSGEEPFPGNGHVLSTRDSIIVRLFLKKRGDRIEPRFEIVPVWTHNRRDVKTCRRLIQTASITDELKQLRKQAGSAEGKDSALIEKEIAYFERKLSAIRYALFRDRVFEEMDFLDR